MIHFLVPQDSQIKELMNECMIIEMDLLIGNATVQSASARSMKEFFQADDFSMSIFYD